MNDNNKSKPATKADLQKLATKADLQKLAKTTKADLQKLSKTTKADLQELARTTKADLQEQAQNTKVDLQELAKTTKTDLHEQAQKTKNDLENLEQKLSGRIDSVETTVKNIAIELAKTQADVREIKYDMATKMSTKDDISRILNAIDKFAAQAENYRRKDLERGHMLMVQDDKLQNHESRLQKLEAK